MPEDITKLAKYGIVGVCIALVIALILTIKMFLGFMADHTDKTTDAVQDLQIVIERLNSNLDRRDIGAMLNDPVVTTAP